MLRVFRADAAFGIPELKKTLEAEGYFYAIRPKGNAVLQEAVAHPLKCPVGRPPNYVRRFYHNFEYRAASWEKARRVIPKVEWHAGDLFPPCALYSHKPTDRARMDHPLLQSARNGQAAHQGRQICDQQDAVFVQGLL